MNDDPDKIVFSHIVIEAPSMLPSEVRELLEANHLRFDNDVTDMVLARNNRELVGCVGLAGNTIKCMAVASAWRRINLSAKLVIEIENFALARGHSHLFLYTQPHNLPLFKGCGFYPIVQQSDVAILMENTPVGISRWCEELSLHKQPGKNIGAIVMNANPFTLGHRYLVDRASSECNWLHLFVVEEDASEFSFVDRLEMIQRGVSDLTNVTVYPGSDYIISRATFPAYFLKDDDKVNASWTAIDLLLFRDYIAPALGINRRYVGTEPFSTVTRLYNQDMHYWLEQAGVSPCSPIKVVELDRKVQPSGKAISATEVRELLHKKQWNKIRSLVPDTTWQYLQQHHQIFV